MAPSSSSKRSEYWSASVIRSRRLREQRASATHRARGPGSRNAPSRPAADKHGEGLRHHHHGHDPARKLGLAQRALRLQERPHLEDDPVRLVVLGREAHEGARVLNSHFESRRPLAARLRVDEIVHCDGPRGFEKRLYFTEEGFREAIERIGASPPQLEEARENAALLRHHGHPLAADRGKRQTESPSGTNP